MMTHKELREKILAGGKLAIQRMIERKRLEDGFVVFSEKGKVVKVKARNLRH